MYKEARGESGLSLAEALVTLGLLCIFLVPAISMIRQAAVNYSRAYADYQTDLAVTGLMARIKDSVGTNGAADMEGVISGCDSGYEYEVIVEELTSGQTHIFRYPAGSGLDIAAAGISPAGDFTGLITAAAKDSRTGLIKIKALPY